MPKNQLAIVGAFTALAALFAAFSWLALDVTSIPPAGAGPDLIVIESEEKHKVTPEMLSAADEAAQTTAPTFRADASDGKTYDLAELTRSGPVVLAFIKEGCPCSVAAQPYFNRLSEAYGARVPFFGVIDAPVERAEKWARLNHAAFPVLSDPDLMIVNDYKAESSAYLALVAQGGAIEKLWPGYSVEMLDEVSARLAKVAEMDVQRIDGKGAPVGEMFTGCPF